ncbi:MAG: preprotein translocase subunit SecE [Candidatus Peribacteraceae bacterium]|nr:preprotein translocase subunit SecE [Candidatus Peribacteraceae bacterium]
MNTIVSYFRESIEELRQVRWPTQKQAIRLTAIVIGFIIVASIFFGVTDLIFSEIIRLTFV